jgi:serine/threonine protein kinase
MMGLEKGQTLLSRFSLIDLLGEGGMGQVWLVRDLELKIHIAIKVLNPRLGARPDRVELLKNECRNARRLIHPHIVRIFDFHRSNNLVFISMEYIDGENLQVYRRRLGILSQADVIGRVRPIVGALSYAHHMGLVHRDLKASNVLLDRQGSPRLADFGIASVLEPGRFELHVTTGGSLYCMSPQQLDGHKPHPSDDIYALGVLMYELLTGDPPFYPEISPEKIHREIPPTVNEQLERRKAGNRVPESLDLLIARLLAKVPEERPSGVEAVGDELQIILDGTPHHTIPPATTTQAPVKTPPPGHHIDMITPAEVSGKDAPPQAPSPWRQHMLKIFALSSALLFLVVGGGLLLHHLSKNPVPVTEIPEEKGASVPIEEKARGELRGDQVKTEPIQTADPSQLALEKEKAEQRLEDYLRSKKALDEKGGAEWGRTHYAKILQLGQEADASFMNKKYAVASQKYDEATVEAKALTGQSEAAFRRLMEEGQLALAEGDGERAQEKFSVALMIDPTNELTLRNLERSKKIESVMQLINSARRHEKANKLSFALADYQEALQFDPESDQARKGFKRVKGLIREEQFQRLMSSGFGALQNKDLGGARTAFLKARSFKPNAPEVQDALAQVDQAIRLTSIENLQKKALDAEQAEDWKMALESYLAVLEMDSTIQFAVQGKARSFVRMQMEKRIKFYLDKPVVLESEHRLENAILLLQEAKAIEPKGPRLMAQLEKLDQMIILAQTPVKVTLESDNLTEVAVYKVGRLGRFHTKELTLRPGTYTVVGMRNGYKDVRQKLVVKPGTDLVRVNIICKEKI